MGNSSINETFRTSCSCRDSISISAFCRLESEGGLEQGPRAFSRFQEQTNPRFPDARKAKAEVGGAASVQIVRGLHGKTHKSGSP